MGKSRMQQLPTRSAHSTVLLLRTTHYVQGLEDFFKHALDISVNFLPLRRPQCFVDTSPLELDGQCFKSQFGHFISCVIYVPQHPGHHGAMVTHVGIFMKAHRQYTHYEAARLLYLRCRASPELCRN